MTHDALPEDGSSDEREALLIGYALNQLSAQQREEVESLLAAQPGLQEQLAHVEAVMGLMAQAVEPVQPPAALRSRILETAQHTAMPSVATPSPNTSAPKAQRWKGLLAMGCILAIGLLLGLDNYRLRTQVAQLESSVTLLTEKEHQTFALRGTSRSPQAIGHVLLDLEKARAVIALHHLSSLPQGSIYHLWAVTAGKVVPCGTLKPDSRGIVLVNIAVPIHEYSGQATRLFITQEESIRVKHPSNRLVMDSVT